ncbi:non-homologous end-joining DNA ligase [Yinghuangia seranimata]|uniref:non-homologous end-joining DNA ligase n=1 Tax=Yinghuangia seranimata TaxID=408067 RepID=UPI00248BC970|nr:non-homologous end-joining DNA ligase [Yinghuangia seranimata]MDI2124681.1 non-homologous end-joining DNA ligase [Yinghuangia seranimata]
MLATLTSRRVFDDRWVFERKLDGVRVLAAFDPDAGVRLTSRTGRALNGTYPEVVAALEQQSGLEFTVDGEVVALEHGRTSFELLQQRLGLSDPVAALATGVAVTYYLFDLLSLDGRDTTGLPLRDRKALLREAIDFHGPLRYTAHRNRGGQELLEEACGKGWEGLIAKRADSRYAHGRSTDWLKLKCSSGQEFVVGGFTEPAGSRAGFGALLVGHYQDGRLRYAGKVGTGYDGRTLTELRARLDALRQDDSPFADRIQERQARWVRPELVAQVGFSEWTRAGRLRHPRFLGLRDDKDPSRVVREEPVPGGTP